MNAEQQAEMEKAMQDPQVQEKMAAMQEAMKKPEVQAQMQEMQSAMANPQLQEKLAGMRDDPEFKAVFEDIQKNGMGALMKYMNDPEFLRKIGSRVGDISPAPVGAGAAAMAGSAAQKAPEVNDLLDAARAGDMEAAEDFIAVGKDVNMQDAEGRTPLHYAAAHNQTRITRVLLEAGADTEKEDSKGNTVLHYAAGYGRLDIVDILLEGGASVVATNGTGKNAAALVRLSDTNPILKDEEIMKKLDS